MLTVVPGLLVRAKRGSRMGIVVEVFVDLNPKDPWIRVCWTHPKDTDETNLLSIASLRGPYERQSITSFRRSLANM